MKTRLNSNTAVAQGWIDANTSQPRKPATAKQINAFLDNHSTYYQAVHIDEITSIGRVKSMQFVNNSLYSYGPHFTIARFATTGTNATKVVLFTNRGFSSSTGQQKALTKRALNAANIAYIEADNAQANCASQHINNLLLLRKDIAAAHRKMMRATKRKSQRATELTNAIRNHNNYVDAFVPTSQHWSDSDIEQDILVAVLQGGL